MSFRNRLRSALFLLVSTSAVFTPQADAGILFGIADGRVVQYGLYGAAVGFGVTQVMLLADDMYSGPDLDWEVIRNDTLIGTALGLVLDVEVSAQDKNLAHTYAKILPWIDNYDVLEELALLSQSKIQSQLKKNPKRGAVLVSFNQSEIDKVFESVSLTHDERAELYRILR